MNSRGTDTPRGNNPEAPSALARLRQETTILPGSAEIDVDAPDLAACEGKELRVVKTPAIFVGDPLPVVGETGGEEVSDQALSRRTLRVSAVTFPWKTICNLPSRHQPPQRQ